MGGLPLGRRHGEVGSGRSRRECMERQFLIDTRRSAGHTWLTSRSSREGPRAWPLARVREGRTPVAGTYPTDYPFGGGKTMRHASTRRTALMLWTLSIVLCLAVAPAAAQNLFVANQGGTTIREFSPEGVDLGDFATTGLNGPTGLAFDRKGNLYVSNIVGNTIRAFSPTGEDLGDFASTGLSSPRGLAFDK